MSYLKTNRKFSKNNIMLLRRKERKIKLATYILNILTLVILGYLNLPKAVVLMTALIILCITATIRYFFSCFRARFQEVKSFCIKHGWKNLILESGMYLAFPPGGVMPLPVPVTANEPLAHLDAKSDLANIVLMPIPWILGAIIGYGEKINWWQTLIVATPFLLMAINYRQLEELIFKIFLRLSRV